MDPWVRKIPWRRGWLPTPVFMPGKSHGLKRLMGYCPWGHKKVRYDLVTEQAHTHTHHRVSLGCREDWKTKNSFANLWQKNIKEKGLRNEHCMSQYNVRYTHHSTPKGGYEDQLCCQI